MVDQLTVDARSGAVRAGVDRVATALAAARGVDTRDAWLAVVADCQALVNTVTAVQDLALAEVARRDTDRGEDGTVVEVVHGHGRVTLDAADLVAPVLGASHDQAERRVLQAVRLAAGRDPLSAEDHGTPEPSGLRGLHAAMGEGRLDGYRAGVVAAELELAPAAVAEAVVAALEAHLDDDAPSLRRRVRRLVARISPDLLRQRAERARASTGLRRWVAEPGVDAWFGTFPSEDAAAAWVAIDRLAHDLVASGTCSTVEQARGRALTDLVTGRSTVDVQVVLTVPADSLVPLPERPEPAGAGASSHAGSGHPSPSAGPRAARARVPASGTTKVDDGHDDDLLEVQGARPSQPLLVRRGWLRAHLCAEPPQRPGGRSGARSPFVLCDPLTGARVDPGDRLATDAYRPGRELIALVRARDGRCRFPGCAVAARFCDLDHVRPWPIGPTRAANLVCLCRRHHRIKQAPGWSLRLDADGTATWTDPSGRVRTTDPLDALAAVVLTNEPPDATMPTSTSPMKPTSTPSMDHAPTPRTEPAAAPSAGPAASRSSGQASTPSTDTWSALEAVLELRLEHHVPGIDTVVPECRTLVLPADGGHRACTSAVSLRASRDRVKSRSPTPDAPPF